MPLLESRARIGGVAATNDNKSRTQECGCDSRSRVDSKIATSLAILTAVQTGYPVLGAMAFPVGFVMIVLLGLELATGLA